MRRTKRSPKPIRRYIDEVEDIKRPSKAGENKIPKNLLQSNFAADSPKTSEKRRCAPSKTKICVDKKADVCLSVNQFVN